MPTQHVFIIGAVWVEPNSSAAGSRMLQIIHLFLAQNWKVSFGTIATKTQNSISLENLGVDEFQLSLNDSSFDVFIKDINPTIVVFDRFMTEEQFGWRVAENCPNALRILDTEDLHCLRKVRQEAYKKNIEFSINSLLQADITKREIASIYRSDLSLIISKAEIELLKNSFQIDEKLLFYLPFLIAKENIKKPQKTFSERIDFVTIGNFLHPPNVAATLTLKKEIWPLISTKLPSAKCHVYGAYPTQQVLQLTDKKQGFFVHGFAESANEVIASAKVLLAPIHFGAGLKGKLLDAMLNGTPSVTTTIGAEGMTSNNNWCGFIEDEAELFAEKAVLLYQDEKLWNTKQNEGFQRIEAEFLKSSFEHNFVSTITSLLQNLKMHRSTNFIGEMLQHHTLKSTKYLSKWIEEKNKN